MSFSVAARSTRRGVVRMTTDSLGEVLFPCIARHTAFHRTSKASTAASLRQVNPPVVAHLDAGRDDNLPRMTVPIGKISGIAAIVGGMRGLQQPGALGHRKRQYRVNFIAGAAVPGERRAAECRGTRLIGQLGIPRE